MGLLKDHASDRNRVQGQGLRTGGVRSQDLGWVDLGFGLDVPLYCQAAMPVLPNSHLPRQSLADVHRDTVSRSYRFGDCFLASSFGLLDRATDAVRPAQANSILRLVSTSSKTFTKPI